jgi:hypothetical protein
MVTGHGGIGAESVETLLKDLRRRFTGEEDCFKEWKLDPSNYRIEGVANRLTEFIGEKAAQSETDVFMHFRICGYSSGQPLAEVWDVMTQGRQCLPPQCLQAQSDFGPRWAGEKEALDRLILGVGSDFRSASVKLGLPDVKADEVTLAVIRELNEPLWLSAMPIQDAIDLAKYCVNTTAGFVRFSVRRQKTVGGLVEVAVITKHEGFKWVQRKHFYTRDLNG